MRSTFQLVLAIIALLCVDSRASAQVPENLRDEQLIAWCIVPFDGKERGPAERAEMVRRLGLKRVAYDWRAKHVAEFEEEILQYRKHGIEFFAFWDAHEDAFALFEKYEIRPQIWKTLGEGSGDNQQSRIASAAEQMLPLVRRTREIGCRLGLYNHGGWGGEPANMVAVCEYLREHHGADHVGIVYNQHHGHAHVGDFAAALETMTPYLLCLNLNGMTEQGDQRGQKILPIGEGELDVELLRTIAESGYDGPIGIIGHTQDDVELRLQDNLDGLHWILPQLEGKPAGAKPELRTHTPRRSPAPPAVSGVLFDNHDSIRRPPLTVECRVVLPDAHGYNILVASDTKASGDHWEVFSMNGSGHLTVYLPGYSPDHIHSQSMICDGKPHTLAMTFAADRVRLFVDGENVADQTVESLNKPARPGRLAIGRLVEGELGCRGSIEWVTISTGVHEIPPEVRREPTLNDSTVVAWQRKDSHDQSDATSHAHHAAPVGGQVHSTFGDREYSAALVEQLVDYAREQGDTHQGLMAFASAESACISCHKIGQHGGDIGPDLSEIGKQRKPSELVESILWPQRHVEPAYIAHAIVDANGRVHRGYVLREDDQTLVICDPTKDDQTEIEIRLDEIEDRQPVGTLMPDNLAGALSDRELAGLLKLMFSLGQADAIDIQVVDSMLAHANVHANGPATFPYEREPLRPELWPHHRHPVNRDRVYDFYAKQADHFRSLSHAPPLLAEFPGLDGGELGHWGNQNDEVWKDNRWNDTELGSLMSGVFRGNGMTIPRAVCVRLGDADNLSVCFNPDTWNYEVLWRNGFLKFSPTRHGFVGGLQLDGQPLAKPDPRVRNVPFDYMGYYRIGARVAFAYRVDGVEIWDSPEINEGRFASHIAPRSAHPLNDALLDSAPQWPQRFETAIEHGLNAPYAVDTIELPVENPWNALLFCSGHAFLPDGSALVCTMQGDVWHVTDFAYPSRTASWRRFASGLHQPQGIVIDRDGIFVLGRDQITRLHDLNEDGEADFYECFSNAFETSPAGHDFICGLERDADGNFYTASGNQGLLRISPDGATAQVLATGFRNPDGLGVSPDGMITVPCSEGEWTPASMICAFRASSDQAAPHFGYPGPRNNDVPALPLAYLPRGIDNSSGGQVYVNSDQWGPLSGQMVHLSFGTGTHFLLLRDEVEGQFQGAIVPLAGDFRSGVHRGRFHPDDGQLYVSGMQGWGSYTPEDGCFERVRYTGGDVQVPIATRVHENGVMIKFSSPVGSEFVSDPQNHFAQCWNYRYSAGYGSTELSSRHQGMRGHDLVRIRSATLMDDGRSLFLELPDLQPVNQLHLRVKTDAETAHDLFVTVHRMRKPFAEFPDYQHIAKTIAPHPILADLAMATRSIPNPHAAPIEGARPIELETGSNLTFAEPTLKAQAGEAIALTLVNPDVVPHNWALLKPGTLERVGRLADRFISDPEAPLRHYVPDTADVIAHTDVVFPRERFTCYFRIPDQPGRYPFLCTFPGHWKVMNGVLIVEE